MLQSSLSKVSGVTASGTVVFGGEIGILSIVEVSQMISLAENISMIFPLSIDKSFLSSLKILRMDSFFTGNETEANSEKAKRLLENSSKESWALRNVLFTLGLNFLTLLIAIIFSTLAQTTSNYNLGQFFQKISLLTRWRLFLCIFRVTSLAQICLNPAS